MDLVYDECCATSLCSIAFEAGCVISEGYWA